jgi:hypothetical protein
LPQIEPYLDDARVHAVAERVVETYPELIDYKTDFLTTRIEPPWYGQLPDGTTGYTNHAVVQFVLVSDNPRPIQQRMGVRHGTVATAWPTAFEEAEEEGHYVLGEKYVDPLERIFRMLAAKHIEELDSLKSIMN